MKTVYLIFLALSVALLAVYFQSDSDLILRFHSDPPANAFHQQIVWITGASSGIGASLALDLTKSGAQVIISARRESQLEEVANACEKVGIRPFVVPLDVTNFEAQKVAYDQIMERFGRVDTLVLNAGRSQRSSAMDTSLTATKELFDLNVLSLISLVKIVVPDMISKRKGQLVVVSSISGIIGVPTSSTYSATKHALHGYFEALRAEIGQHNISIVMVCPGPVESEISKHAVFGESIPLPKRSEEKKMATERCTELMVKGMYHKLPEIWISDQPIIVITHIAKYLPLVMRPLSVKVVGPIRLKMLESGELGYDMMKNFGLKK